MHLKNIITDSENLKITVMSALFKYQLKILIALWYLKKLLIA
jgi:hypothetical protein